MEELLVYNDMENEETIGEGYIEDDNWTDIDSDLSIDYWSSLNDWIRMRL